MVSYLVYKSPVNLLFQNIYSVFCTEYLLLVLFQFGSYISFGVYESLLSYPLRRNLVLMRIPHLEIVTEHIVVTYLERRYSCPLHLLLLKIQQIVFSMPRQFPEPVEFFVYSVCNNIALSQLGGWIGEQLPLYLLQKIRRHVNLLPEFNKLLHSRFHAYSL